MLCFYQMPHLWAMQENQTPWGRPARPEKGVGVPRRRCRPTSRPSEPPEPSAASPSATPSAWQRWPWSSGNILFFCVSKHSSKWCECVNVWQKMSLTAAPQAFWYLHPSCHFCQLCSHGRHQTVPWWRLQRHQPPAGEFPDTRQTVNSVSWFCFQSLTQHGFTKDRLVETNKTENKPKKRITA